MTGRNRFPLATRGLTSSLSPTRSAARSAASVLFGTPRGGGPRSPSTCTSGRTVPFGWSGAGRLRPKASRPRPLTLRPAPRPWLAPPAGPPQPQPRCREVYLSPRSPESSGRSVRRRLFVSMVLPPRPVLPHPGPEPAMRALPSPAPTRRGRTAKGGSCSFWPPSLGLSLLLSAPPLRPGLLKGNALLDPASAAPQGLVSICTANTLVQSSISLAETVATLGASPPAFHCGSRGDFYNWNQCFRSCNSAPSNSTDH